MRLSTLPAYQSKFFKAVDLHGVEQTVIISSCEIRDNKKYMSDETERRAFLKLEGTEKELQIATINQSILEEAFGDHENFAGKTIILFPTKAPNGTDIVGIRPLEKTIQVEEPTVVPLEPVVPKEQAVPPASVTKKVDPVAPNAPIAEGPFPEDDGVGIEPIDSMPPV